MTAKNANIDKSDDFKALAKAYKHQFRLNLSVESVGKDGTVNFVDDNPEGNVKYLGTLRSNWLRRHSEAYGFTSIGHSLLPEVAGGAYTYAKTKPEDEEPQAPQEPVVNPPEEAHVSVVNHD